MVGENRAVVANRSAGSLTFDERNGGVPNRDQWIRDYVDKRAVSDEMVVLVATVVDGEVDTLHVNRECASEYAERVSQDSTGVVLTDVDW